jgi:hydrogenase nickel incorporation protein HypA/HybF
MHELAITRNVIAICVEHAGGARVTRVRLEIGKLSGIMADAVRFCFDAARSSKARGWKLSKRRAWPFAGAAAPTCP